MSHRTAADRTSKILSEIELRPFPAAASRLLTACDEPCSTAKIIADIIKHDPALSLRLLQIANSPLYGLSGQIRSIDHATVVLGFRTVKDIAISLAVGRVFDEGAPEFAESRKELWAHSLACGSFAGILADRTKKHAAEEAFLAGILHDVGKLLLLDYASSDYAQLLCGPTCSITTEAEAFGTNHATIGQYCVEDWGLPMDICEAIGHHHQPDEAEAAVDFVQVVSVANELAHAWRCGIPDDSQAQSDVLQSVGLTLSGEETVQFCVNATTQLNAVLEVYS